MAGGGFPAPVLALDQGTSSSRALYYEGTAAPKLVQYPLASITPKGRDGWVEQDPEAIWQTSLDAMRAVLAQASRPPAVLGITNQRETTLIWERATGKPIYNAIVWQDRRTELYCQHLRERGLREKIARRTGLVLDPYFSATKIKWILDEIEGARASAEKGQLAFGTVESFLIYRLTEGRVHASDATNAARTLLFDIEKNCWDAELLDLFDIPASLLPEVRDCAGDFGETVLLGDGAIPICGAIGDQQSAAVGQNCFEAGQAKSTYGTGCFLLTHAGAQMPDDWGEGLLATLAWRLDGKPAYALEGSIFMAGSVVQWLRDRLGILSDASESAALAAAADESSGVVFVPALGGLGAPYWDADARGAIMGLAQNSGAPELVRASLESVAFQTHDLLEAMGVDTRPHILRVDGGMAANDWFMQALADICGIVVERPLDIETTARGAAVMAALGAGLFTSLDEAAGHWQCDSRFSPSLDDSTRTRKLTRWHEAIQKVLTK